MPVEKKLEVGVINVTAHPHTPETYIKLFKAASKIGAVKIRGNSFAELCHVTPESSTNLIYAEIYKYTDIDASSSWFNKLTSKLATQEEIDSITIPDEYKPNAAKFSVYLYPEKHLIFYESYYDTHSLGPKSATDFFGNLFKKEEIQNQFGVINVFHIPEKQLVDQIISSRNKELLYMTFTRPNPDSLEEMENELLDSMNDRNVAEITQEYKSTENEFIKMDNKLTLLSRIAAKNGILRTKIKNPNGSKTEISTASHPFKRQSYYDPKVTLSTEHFKSIVVGLIEKTKEWLN